MKRLVECDAMVLDLDGVVTDTASVHERAWKELFDDVLRRRGGDGFRPFSSDDYRRYVDGKPRLDGLRSFLASRGIEMREGAAGDAADAETVHGLAARKNRIFQQRLAQDGVHIFDDAVAELRAWRRAGIPRAVVSSSRNCQMVLERAGIDDLFDVRIDGVVAAKLELAGKPAPDFFLEAARRLDVAPARAAAFEDAVSGVRACRAGNFGVVVGVARDGDARALIDAGADVVSGDFRDLQAPRALARTAEIHGLLRGRRVAAFLDYDGTLTAIVDDPAAARLPERMRTAVRRLARVCPVAIVSGRDLRDVRERVGIEGLYYAGSHGLEIAGPRGDMVHEAAARALPSLDSAEAALRERLAGVRGAIVERKRLSLAIHYRMVADREVAAVVEAARAELARRPELREMQGKQVLELSPDVDWDKGRAVDWMIGALGIDRASASPIYIGDDTTDEDAFRALRRRGLGIVVADAPRGTVAAYRLADPDEVRVLLVTLTDIAAR